MQLIGAAASMRQLAFERVGLLVLPPTCDTLAQAPQGGGDPRDKRATRRLPLGCHDDDLLLQSVSGRFTDSLVST